VSGHGVDRPGGGLFRGLEEQHHGRGHAGKEPGEGSASPTAPASGRTTSESTAAYTAGPSALRRELSLVSRDGVSMGAAFRCETLSARQGPAGLPGSSGSAATAAECRSLSHSGARRSGVPAGGGPSRAV
jgi:hypothetical protein